MTARPRRWRAGLAMVAAVAVMMAACAVDEIRERLEDFWFDLRDWRTARPVPRWVTAAIACRQQLDAAREATDRAAQLTAWAEEIPFPPPPPSSALQLRVDNITVRWQDSWCDAGRTGAEFTWDGAEPEYQPGGEGSLAVTEADKAAWRAECEAADAYRAKIPDEPLSPDEGGSGYTPGWGQRDLAADPCGASGPVVPRKAPQS